MHNPADTDANEPAQSGRREYHRAPWTGNLDEKELQRPGSMLLAALVQCANERRHQMQDLARELGVTYGYINQLRSGLRNTSQISDDFALACARYLGVPRLTVLMLAGRLTIDDAFEPDRMLANEVPRALEYVTKDPEWGPLVTREVRAASCETQFLVVRLYESATGKKLLPDRLNVQTLAEDLRRLRIEMERRQKLFDAYVEKKNAKSNEGPEAAASD